MLVNFRSVPSPGEKLVREILRGPRIFVRAEVRIAPSFCLARRSALGSIPAVSAYGSAEARDSTDGLPLTVREQSFVLGPPDGKVCPEADLADAREQRRGWGGKETFALSRNQTPE